MNKEARWSWSKVLFIGVAAATLLPFCSASLGLVAGIAFALLVGNPLRDFTAKLTPRLLAWSIVGLGAGMDLVRVGEAGVAGLGYTGLGIFLTVGFGLFLGRWLKVERDTSLLLSIGTAICGGSAIAAVAVAIKAKASDVTIAMVTVFLLNAVAIIVFPQIGHIYGLTEPQFGLWAALAIHDTSSVVGAAMQYGAVALEVGTTVKLARALWIIPVSFGTGHLWARLNKRDGGPGKVKRPYFIIGFVVAAAIVTFWPELKPLGLQIAAAARRLLVLALFLIGSGMTLERIKQVGFRPFVQGVILWIAMAALSLGGISNQWIRL